MPGIPRSLGCSPCLKRKKKCDEAKPVCGLCFRLGINCIGNGVKRLKFLSYGPADRRATPSPSRSPTNETTMTTTALVHILQIEDVRYDIRAFGLKVMTELPAHMGVCPELDTAVSAVVTLYNSHLCKRSTVKGLTQYGAALAATSKLVKNPGQSPRFLIQALFMLHVCQFFIDRKNSDLHRVMGARAFRDAVIQGTVNQLEPVHVYGLCQVAVWASLADPSFELGSWFWAAHRTCTAPGPIRYHQGASFHSLEVTTLAAASTYLRQPAQHVYQLQCTYDLILQEKPRMRQLAAMATEAALAPTGSVLASRLRHSYLFAWGTMLGLEAVIGNVLRNFDSGVFLQEAARDCYHETLDLARQSADIRPIGAGFLPDVLKAVWAGTSDIHNDEEMERIMKDYETDVQGADFINEALDTKGRLEKLAKYNAVDRSDQADTLDREDIMPTEAFCIIL